MRRLYSSQMTPLFFSVYGICRFQQAADAEYSNFDGGSGEWFVAAWSAVINGNLYAVNNLTTL